MNELKLITNAIANGCVTLDDLLTHSIAEQLVEQLVYAQQASLQELHSQRDRMIAELEALQLRLAPGMGLVCNNVLHDRAAFVDSTTQRRLILRARFYERITL